MIRYEQLTINNFNENALDTFERHQQVTQCWRKVDGMWKLLPIAFVEEWNLEKRRSNARSIAANLGERLVGFGVFENDRVVGYITLGTSRFGSRRQYVQLVEFQVSEPWRGKKIGRRLFSLACKAAGEMQAEKLYISAHSSKESQAAYRALGCVEAQEIDRKLAEEEPCDVQMEYRLR